MTLPERMDHLVHVMRLDRLFVGERRPRTFRWTPLLVIAALVVGYVQMTQTGNKLVPGFFVGWLVFYGAFLAAAFLRALGPRFTATVHQPLDERELMVKARAHAVSGMVLAGVVMLGCFYMTSSAVPWLWHPQAMDWFHLGFGVQAVSALLPTWIASWLEPRAEMDLED